MPGGNQPESVSKSLPASPPIMLARIPGIGRPAMHKQIDDILAGKMLLLFGERVSHESAS
jgi:hypothetical protein